MHIRETVELAGWIATHGHVFCRDGWLIPTDELQEFWAASRCRQNRWSRKLKTHVERTHRWPQRDAHRLWRLTLPTLEEILTSDILCRVWVAVCTLSEKDVALKQATPIARNILSGQLEARRRVLRLIVKGEGLPVEQAVQLNRLRRQNERWTDVLLSACGQGPQIEELAYRSDRVRDFAVATQHFTSLSLMIASLRAAYRDGISAVAANADLNQRIAASLLRCIAPSEFDGTGLPRSAWIQRMTRAASDTAGMIDQLLQLDAPDRWT